MAEGMVRLAVEGGVATVELNRPDAYNALDGQLADDLYGALERIEGDPAVRVVVLRGAGKGFMAGGDVKSFATVMDRDGEARRHHFERLIGRVHPSILLMRRLEVPVVASVHGAAAGFGMSLVLAADLAVAAAEAFFTLAYCHLGTTPDGGSTWFLPRHVGSKKAMEIALLGDRFDAATALSLGIVNEVVPGAELGARTTALAARLARGPRRALAETKRLLVASHGTELVAQLADEARSFARCTATEDFAEGVAAFVGKRPPAFS